jgi:hypothetical protein
MRNDVIVLCVEVSVQLALNLTASAYPDQLNPIIPYGWLLVAMQVIYILFPRRKIAGWFTAPMRRRTLIVGYLIACVIGAGIGAACWLGVTSAIEKLEEAKKAKSYCYMTVQYDKKNPRDHTLWIVKEGDKALYRVTWFVTEFHPSGGGKIRDVPEASVDSISEIDDDSNRFPQMKLNITGENQKFELWFRAREHEDWLESIIFRKVNDQLLAAYYVRILEPGGKTIVLKEYADPGFPRKPNGDIDLYFETK